MLFLCPFFSCSKSVSLLHINTKKFIKSYETLELRPSKRFPNVEGGYGMRGAPILLIFFLMFTTASLLAPFPMFPGNFICYKLGPTINEYALYFSALMNGLLYGAVIWAVFAGISRKLEQEA